MTPIISPELPAAVPPLRQRITAAYLRDETEALGRAAGAGPAAARTSRPGPGHGGRTGASAPALRAADPAMVEAFMREYDLSSEEGVLLMCVAEALLRIPDQDTANKLIRDKLGDADWDAHVGKSSSVLVNASTWGLMLTGRIVNLADETRRDVAGAFRRLVGRIGEPAIRLAVRQAMRIMGHQFVMGRTIERGAGALAQGRQRQLPLFLRHARRGRLHRRRCRALPRGLSPGDRRDRRRRARIRTCSPRPRSRSSCRRCIRATSSPSAPACWPN